MKQPLEEEEAAVADEWRWNKWVNAGERSLQYPEGESNSMVRQTAIWLNAYLVQGVEQADDYADRDGVERSVTCGRPGGREKTHQDDAQASPGSDFGFHQHTKWIWARKRYIIYNYIIYTYIYYVYRCVDMYIYVYTCIHMHTHTHLYIYIHKYVCMYVYF